MGGEWGGIHIISPRHPPLAGVQLGPELNDPRSRQKGLPPLTSDRDPLWVRDGGAMPLQGRTAWIRVMPPDRASRCFVNAGENDMVRHGKPKFERCIIQRSRCKTGTCPRMLERRRSRNHRIVSCGAWDTRFDPDRSPPLRIAGNGGWTRKGSDLRGSVRCRTRPRSAAIGRGVSRLGDPAGSRRNVSGTAFRRQTCRGLPRVVQPVAC